MAAVDDLAALQDLDDALAKDTTRLREIRGQMHEPEALAAARAAAEQAERDLAAVRHELRELEAEAQSVRQKRQAGQARLYGGKVVNPRELQSLESESEALGRRLSQLDDQALDRMVSAEQALALRDETAARLAEQAAAEAERMRDLTLQAEAVTQQGRRHQEAVQRLRAALPPVLLARYDSIKARKAGRAMARLRRGVCGACGVQVPTHVVQRAQQKNDLVPCPSCARLLCPE
ncbi:MAG: zinc ribbon domain-containing protein [Anaerolineae bacterium]